jgi:multisubunit Na+/H+ antiporter MnhG subunit
MPAVTGLFLMITLLAVAAPLVLYALVRSEHEQHVETDRETAERLARRDTDDDSRVR